MSARASRHLLRRIGLLAVTLLITSLIVFINTQWLPGDVERIILGREAGAQALENLRKALGRDQPLPLQYINWIGNFIIGNWGRSYSTQELIRPMVLDRLGNSLMLALVTLVIAIPLSLLLGFTAGLKENKPIDHVISISSLSVVGLPEFVTGLVLIHILALRLHLLPANLSIPPGTTLLDRGQEGRPQHAQGKDVSFLVNAVPAFQFDTKLDGGSEFSVTRFLFQFDLSKRIDGARDTGISLFYDHEDYDFRGATSFAGPSPWNTVHRIGFGIPFVQRLESDWRLVFTPSAEISRESGAGWGNALAYGAVLSAGKRVGDTLTLGIGAGVFYRLEEVNAFPYLVVDWRITAGAMVILFLDG